MTGNSKKFKEQKGVTTEYGGTKNLLSMDIVESPVLNSQVPLLSKKTLSKEITQTVKSSKIQEVGSISKEKVLKPYWNNQCQELQSKLWLPHKIELLEQGSNLSNGSLNYMEEKLKFWKTQVKPLSNSIPKPLFHSSPHLSTPTTESEVKVVTKKIRIYPENKSGFFDFLNLHRRAYNLTIEKLKEKTDLKKSEVRSLIREITRKESVENNTVFSSVVSDEAVANAYLTFESCIRKWKKKQKAELKFKSVKQTRQNFIVQKLSKGGVFPRVLGKCFLTESIPVIAINHMAKVTYERGRWFLCCKDNVKTKSCEIQADLNKTVSLDQGIRTFVTSYNPTESVKYGDGFSEEKLLPLYSKLDYLKSKRSKLLKKKFDAQWWFDRMRSIQNKIHKTQNKINDLIDDLHHKVCYDLVSNYDHIMVPQFEVSNMVNKKNRKLNKRTVREMIHLSFFKFKQRLKWYCLKYGKNFIETTEEYTSKTKSWNGVIDNKLGSKKIIKDDKISVDRDINGARGIFFLTLTR